MKPLLHVVHQLTKKDRLALHQGPLPEPLEPFKFDLDYYLDLAILDLAEEMASVLGHRSLFELALADVTAGFSPNLHDLASRARFRPDTLDQTFWRSHHLSTSGSRFWIELDDRTLVQGEASSLAQILEVYALRRRWETTARQVSLPQLAHPVLELRSDGSVLARNGAVVLAEVPLHVDRPELFSILGDIEPVIAAAEVRGFAWDVREGKLTPLDPTPVPVLVPLSRRQVYEIVLHHAMWPRNPNLFLQEQCRQALREVANAWGAVQDPDPESIPLPLRRGVAWDFTCDGEYELQWVDCPDVELPERFDDSDLYQLALLYAQGDAYPDLREHFRAALLELIRSWEE